MIIYTTKNCSYCEQVKEFLRSHGVAFFPYDISEDNVKRDEIIKRTGQMSVPVVELDNGEYIIGFNKMLLMQKLGLSE